MARLSVQQRRILLQLVCVLAVAAAACVEVSQGSMECPSCGESRVPYPLGTSPSCGHPLYRLLTCTPEKQLQVNALSGNYTVQSLDPSNRTMVISTAAFLGDSCITADSIAAHNFSLVPDSPLTIAPGNTVLLLNASELLRYTPLNCSPGGPCRLLPQVRQRSCHNLSCCSFTTGASVFRYGFFVFATRTGYVSVPTPLGAEAGADAGVKFGLRLQWEMPTEPPCEKERQCGGNSTCGKNNICACNDGYEWDPTTGTCPKVPLCIRNSRSIECHKIEYATGLALAVTGLIAVISVTVCLFKRHRRALRVHTELVKERALILATSTGGKSARLFSNKEMKRATNNFARDRMLGCGGFGEVYKGVLDDDTEVAIKCAKIGLIKGIDQVLNEVRILSQVNHRSLVRLLGCCVESELPLMVYEYVPSGNLYDRLLTNSNTLDWRTRLRIAFQSAEGLAFLHSAGIYHRDVKSSNILLDKSMNARVSDFGLSRLAERDLSHVSTHAQGTLGYLDPEYYRNYQLTDKSDVYSFGVVLLELVTSQKAIDCLRSRDDRNLPVMVRIRKEEGKIDEVFDLQLVKGASKETLNSMRSVVDLALECLQENRVNRPSMKEVAETLQQIMSSF